MKKIRLFSILITALLYACVTTDGTDTHTAPVDNEVSVSSPASLLGTYYTKFSHSECGSLRVNLVLDMQQYYEKVVECLNGNAPTSYESGKWLKQGITITLHPDEALNTTPAMLTFIEDVDGLILEEATEELRLILFHKL